MCAIKTGRFFEIDFLRGIAILMMIIFHFFFDLDYFGILNNQMYSGMWLIFQRTTAILFILLFGVSLAISYQKEKSFTRFLNRALFLGFVALLITFMTWIYPHNGFIIFGIIHFFALSIILAYLFLRFDYFNLIAGIFIIILGLKTSPIIIDTNILFWLGFTFHGFYSLDYFPILPWFGIVLIGIFLGKHLYYKGKKRFGLEIPKQKITELFAFAGKNSLMLYLIHQPIIIGILQLCLALKIHI